jgi:hypothetical protein
MSDKIDINSAEVGELTQLPGVNKTIAYNIVNHRDRHGLFTVWEELEAVKEFPVSALSQIRERAELRAPAGEENFHPPHRAKHEELEKKNAAVEKQTRGYTKGTRPTRRPDHKVA